jgi:hypothetical protein
MTTETTAETDKCTIIITITEATVGTETNTVTVHTPMLASLRTVAHINSNKIDTTTHNNTQQHSIGSQTTAGNTHKISTAIDRINNQMMLIEISSITQTTIPSAQP